MNGNVHLSCPPIKFYRPQKLFDSPPYTDPWLADNTPTPSLGHVCKSQMVRLRDLWKEVTPSVPIEQGVVARSGGKVVKTVKSSPFSFDRGNAANLIHKICPLVHCTELGGDVRSTMEEDVRRALCYDRCHKQLRVDGRDPVPDRLGDTVVSLLGLQPVRAVEVRLQQTSPAREDVVGDGRTVVQSKRYAHVPRHVRHCPEHVRACRSLAKGAHCQGWLLGCQGWLLGCQGLLLDQPATVPHRDTRQDNCKLRVPHVEAGRVEAHCSPVCFSHLRQGRAVLRLLVKRQQVVAFLVFSVQLRVFPSPGSE